ncbi:MAG: hypothetical protein K2L87_01795 [Clostridiales bacterium]|nr:hypothetical protein [Clostridiales bacterium]
MLYRESKKSRLSSELFRNPTKEYRGAPFFSWNCALNEELLNRRIDDMKAMRFGGFFMHVRSGLATEYLGEEFMGLVRSCVEHAKREDMLAYLYDEDRWPSGYAGGLVTKKKEFRRQTVCLSLLPPEEFSAKTDTTREPKLLAVYDLVFDEADRLGSYARISLETQAKGEKWYLYRLLQQCSGRFNGYTYADILNPEAVEEFLRVTHEAYRREVGDEFGKAVPAIFSDEPNYLRFTLKEFARDNKDTELPFSQVLLKEFSARCGYDLLDRFPEVVWNLSGDAPSKARYQYYRTLTELMAESYCDRVGQWCEEHGIAFTGHVLEEPTLLTQMCAVGEAMRHYRGFTIPGIDMLCDNREWNTAKQAQSAAHQYGREGVMSELYGVTGWDFDFRGHKFQGDWQAALGVTLRVPHLFWTSMRGSAKRDYPASIGYQSAWYQEYGYLEDHFARLNTALTRGKPVVRVAVLHPEESAWLVNGVREHAAEGDALDRRFSDLTEWLLRGQIDFDFISESLLPEQYRETANGLQIGEMNYSAVIVPPLVTVRQSTVDALARFAKKGGRLIMCACPALVDAEAGKDAKELYALAEKVPFAEREILQCLEAEREISIFGERGKRSRDWLYNLREDGDCRWLFLAHGDSPSRTDGADCNRERLKVRVKGAYHIELYDTLSGDIKELSSRVCGEWTETELAAYPLDSFLLRLSPTKDGKEATVAEQYICATEEIGIPDDAEVVLGESNVAVLDLCEWSLDGKEYFPREEMLRIDSAIRKRLGYPAADGQDKQPWCIEAKEPSVFPHLRFTFESEVETPCMLAYENLCEVKLNGKDISIADEGYFTDEAIRVMRLPNLKKGKNELVLRAAVGERVSLENFFLLGDFGVHAEGSHWIITKRRERISYGSITGQGMPFYGAAITYRIPFECGGGELCVTADFYHGALISAKLDGEETGKVVLPPYKLHIPDVSAGKHVLELTLYASRINSFGALHACVPIKWKGPSMWYTSGNCWSYEYALTDVGIMKKPVLRLFKK